MHKKNLIYKFALTAIIVGFFILSVKSQETVNYPEINIKTYDQYLKSEWKDLIKTGKISLKNDIDFYYLQVRMGIAYYELKKYRQAINYFENARDQNPNDELIKEYLYYSYLFSGRIEDARKFTSVLSVNLKEKIGIKQNPIFSSIYIETKFDNWKDYTAETNTGDILKQDIRTDFSYYSVNFENLIQNDKRIYWGYTGINILNNSFVVEENSAYNFNRSVKQSQLYFKFSKQAKYGLKFNLAFNTALIFSDELTTVQTKGAWSSSSVGIQKVTTGAFIGFLSFEKDFSLLKFELSNSLSAINGQFQIQPGLSMYFYPFGNNNFYTLSSINNQFDFSSNGTISQLVVNQSIGLKIYKIFIEPAISFGNFKNYVSNHAFVIYNDLDVIKDMKSVKIYGYLFNYKLTLFAKYEDYIKINEYKINDLDFKKEYSYNAIIGGIKWNF
ncbi:MAG: hypothetical protein JXR51_16640 [Bacteroidales bacterium]|nr:hypothetical protein [Bacteroidales bacterium]